MLTKADPLLLVQLNESVDVPEWLDPYPEYPVDGDLSETQ